MSSPWQTEARALFAAGATPAEIRRRFGKSSDQVKIALDLDDARERSRDAHRRSREAKRGWRPGERKGAPIAGVQTPRQALTAALAAYDAGRISLGEMAARMAGVGT
jgi:hypothetical protein